MRTEEEETNRRRTPQTGKLRNIPGAKTGAKTGGGTEQKQTEEINVGADLYVKPVTTSR
jgi:hypothetical protein